MQEKLPTRRFFKWLPLILLIAPAGGAVIKTNTRRKNGQRPPNGLLVDTGGGRGDWKCVCVC